MYNISEVIRLSQEEGLNDRQIAETIGCARVTISRIRKRNNIPKCKIEKRKDKKCFVCLGCNETIFIRRNEQRSFLCEDCTKKLQ